MTRKYSIDILRIISAIAIVLIHVVSAPVVNRVSDVDDALITNLKLIQTLMNWAVPVFFMITGYCLLKKDKCTYKYCFSHVLKYIGVLFTVGLFYALLEEFFKAKTISASMIARSILNVISGRLWDHMWFVYAIIGIYLAMPVIHYFMQQGTSNILVLTGLLFFFNILCPTVEEWMPIGIPFPFGDYLFYVCFGGAVAKLNISKTSLYWACPAGLLSMIWIIISEDSQRFTYRHLAVCLMAISVFMIFSSIDVKPNALLLKISQCTWGIYLLHPFFINVAIKVLKIDLLGSLTYVKLLVFAILVLLVSFIGTYLLKKVPFVKKLF